MLRLFSMKRKDLKTRVGRFLIEGSLRQGRANMTDIYLVTQAFMDYDKEDKKNYCLINLRSGKTKKKHRKKF